MDLAGWPNGLSLARPRDRAVRREGGWGQHDVHDLQPSRRSPRLAACRTEVCGWSRRRVLALWGSAGRWEFVVERGFGPEMGVGGRQSVERRRATASSGSGAGEYALDVPGHGDEAPLAAHFVEAAQHKLTESERRFDDAEHRLRDL